MSVTQIETALETLGFRRAHFSVRDRRGRFHIEVLAWGKRWSLEMRCFLSHERTLAYLRKMLPCPTGPHKRSA